MKTEEINQNMDNSSTYPKAPYILTDVSIDRNPGKFKIRMIHVSETGKKISHTREFEHGTNNIGKFLAIMGAIKYCELKAIENPVLYKSIPIYTDSTTALTWLKRKETKKNTIIQEVYDLLVNAEIYLANNTIPNPILKWDTAKHGIIPVF